MAGAVDGGKMGKSSEWNNGRLESICGQAKSNEVRYWGISSMLPYLCADTAISVGKYEYWMYTIQLLGGKDVYNKYTEVVLNT